MSVFTVLQRGFHSLSCFVRVSDDAEATVNINSNEIAALLSKVQNLSLRADKAPKEITCGKQYLKTASRKIQTVIFVVQISKQCKLRIELVDTNK